MKTEIFSIAKVYNTFEEYVNSPEIASIYRGYENNLRDLHYRNARTEFIQAFVVETDPEKNYGQSADVYVHFKIADRDLKGMQRLMKVTIHSCLHNSGFQIANIRDGYFSVNEERFEQSDRNRRILH